MDPVCLEIALECFESVVKKISEEKVFALKTSEEKKHKIKS